MNLFDELEKDAKEIQAKQPAAAEQSAEVEAYYSDYCAPLMRKFDDYLKKLAKHINKVGYTRNITLDIPQFGKVEGCVQPEIEVLSAVADSGTEIKMTGLVHIDRDSAPVRKVNPAHCSAVEREVSTRGLRATKRNITKTEQEEAAVAYRIFGDLKQTAVIKSSKKSKKISMIFNNFDSLCTRQKMVLGENIDKAFFDEIGRYLTGKSIAMFEEKVSTDLRDELRRKLHKEKTKQALELLESEISRIDQELEEEESRPSLLRRQFDKWLEKFLRKDS